MALACLRVGLRVTCVPFCCVVCRSGVSGCVRNRVSCVRNRVRRVRDRVRRAGFCCESRRIFEGWLWPRCDVTPDSGMRSQWPGATGGMCGGVRGADSWQIRGPDAGPRICLFQAPGTLPGGVPESDPELCFLTGKGRVRAGSPGSEFRRSGCHPSSLTVVRGEIAAKGMSGVRVRLGPETHAP